MILGIDISSENAGTVNFGAVRASGVSRVILRATDGIGWSDPSLAPRYAAASAAGIDDVWAYHFLRVRHGRQQDAAVQVRDYAAAAPWTPRPIFDCEPVPVGGAEHNAATGWEWRDALLQALDAAWGAKPIVYGSPAFFAARPELAGCAELAERADLWVAAYGFSEPPTCPPWTDWLGWQHTGSGTCPGVSGAVDLSWWKA